MSSVEELKQALAQARAEAKAEKQKKLNSRYDVIIHKLNELREVEKAFDMSKRVCKEGVKLIMKKWYYNKLTPYNPMMKPKESKTLFVNNAKSFFELVKQLKGTSNFGIINSCNSTKQGNIWVKTKHGVYVNDEAKLYLRYCINNLCLKVMKEYMLTLFKQSEKTPDSLDGCLRSLSFIQLFNRSSQDYLFEILLQEYYDAEFADCFKNSGFKYPSCVVKMSNKVKQSIIKTEVKEDYENEDLLPSDDSDSEEDETDETEETEDDESD